MTLFDDPQFYHMESYPRRFPNGMELQSIGYIPRKREWIKRPFDTLNFSFILSGQGFYSHNGTLHPIQAPAVLTQSPDVSVHYGPETTWEELFFIYPAKWYQWFESRGFLNRSWWKIQSPGSIRNQIRDLFNIIGEQRENRLADQADLTVQKLVMDSLQESSRPRDTPVQVFVHRLYDEMEQNCSGDYDFHRLTGERGFSISGFRRAWEASYGAPPGQVLIEFKMRKACRLLAETDRPVKEIAGELGFPDPLYFSKMFKKKRRESPRMYRKRTREPYFGSN